MTNEMKLEKRLENTERALFSLWSILHDLQPPSVQSDINGMMNEYINANDALGSGIADSTGFIR